MMSSSILFSVVSLNPPISSASVPLVVLRIATTPVNSWMPVLVNSPAVVVSMATVPINS